HQQSTKVESVISGSKMKSAVSPAGRQTSLRLTDNTVLPARCQGEMQVNPTNKSSSLVVLLTFFPPSTLSSNKQEHSQGFPSNSSFCSLGFCNTELGRKCSSFPCKYSS
ncbi:unnamed protein product, partial [Tetraodon nigroviridis]